MTRGSAIRIGLCLSLASGCSLEAPETEESRYPSAGLYTPGNRLGASDPTDTPVEGAGLGQRCVSLGNGIDGGMAPSPGTLEATYTTRSLDGLYAPKNCTAAWVETMDGRYVATLEVRAALQLDGLVYFAEHACTEKPGPDVVSKATIANHDTTHMLSWSGVDFEQQGVLPGTYQLFIEVTESDKSPGYLTSYDFEVGASAYEMDLPVDDQGAVASLSIAWEPE